MRLRDRGGDTRWGIFGTARAGGSACQDPAIPCRSTEDCPDDRYTCDALGCRMMCLNGATDCSDDLPYCYGTPPYDSGVPTPFCMGPELRVGP